jgi:hypothetical protein
MSHLKLLTDREHLKIYLELQVAVALTSPEHLNHLQLESGRSDYTFEELMRHFAGHNDSKEGLEFAGKYGRLFREHWDNMNSGDNRWYAGQLFHHEPSAFEAALYYFASMGLFQLEVEMIPEIIATLDRAKYKVPAS